MSDDRSNGGADAELERLYGEEWQWRREELGTQYSWMSDETDAFLPDIGPEAQQRRLERWEQTHGAVSAIEPESLSPAARSDRAVYLDQLEVLINQQRFRTFEAPANADSSFWNELIERTRKPITEMARARNHVAQLRDVPRWIEQHVTNMRAGLQRGYGPPRVTMLGREATARTVAEESDPATLAFVTALEALPTNQPERDVLITEATEVVVDHVQPAYAALLDFLVEEYLPNLPEALAACEIVGTDYYRAQLREFTTLDLGPQEIHEVGLREVAGIRAEMAEIANELGYDDDVEALLAFMRTDPQFYVDEPEDLLREAAWQAKKFDAVVHRYFGRVPRMRFAIVEPPPDLAPFYTFGRGGIDTYTLNTYSLPDRPLYSLPALTLHEAAPGHAFQTPLSLEQTQHPEFRRMTYISAFGEGWALYCERLGVEMGIYATPYERMGMLSYQMWRAVRLVIDPGLHALGWTREEAQDFLRRNTAIGEHEIITEVDRYIAWPGQATSYYLGQLTIMELRAKAEAALGAAFDLRWFHDQVLSLGSVPLSVLRTEIDRFIERGGTSPFAEEAS